MTPEQRKLVLLAKARSLSTEGQSTGAADQEQETVFSGFGTAFKANVDPILEGMGTTAEVLGFDGVGKALKGATELPKNYKSSSDAFMNEDEDGSFAWRHLPGAVAEQAGQFAGSVASRALGAAGGAALGGAVGGPTGAGAGGLAGAFTGPMVFQIMQQLGPIAQERARNDGRSEVSQEDFLAALATASASGALDAIAPGATGIAKRMILEGVTEGAQSVIEQTGESVGTDAGLKVSPRQALGEGIIGSGSAGVVDTSMAGAQKVASTTGQALSAAGEKVRYDNKEFSDDEKRAAQALIRAADGSMDTLGNVDDEGQGTAKGAANAALRDMRARSEEHSKDLRKLIAAFPEDSFEARAALKALNKIDQHQGSPLPKSYADELKTAMGNLDPKYADLPEVENLISLSNQINTVQDFTSKSDRDMGGVGRLTKQFDILDKRNTTKLGAYALLGGNVAAGPLGIGTAVAHVAGMRALNKAAKTFDRITNQRSKVKRFVDSALRDGKTPADLRPQQALQALAELKQKRAAEAAAQKLAMEVAQAKANGTYVDPVTGLAMDQSKAQGPAAKAPTKAELKAQAEAERNASLYKLNAEATLPVFESGQIPDHPMFNTYRFMKEQTGLDPEDALGVIEQLEREGSVPKGTAQKFVEQPMAFADDQEWTMGLQQAVKARANPDFDHKAAAEARAKEAANQNKPPVDPDRVVRKLQGMVATTKNRYDHKRLQGQIAGVQLDEDIREALPGLSAEQHQNLLDLRQSLDAPDMTRAERFKLLNEYLPMIFPKKNEKALVEFWRKKFNPLAAAGNDEAYHIQVAEKEQQKEENLDKAIAESVKRKKRAKKSAAKPKKEVQPDSGRSQPQTPEDRALERLKKPVEKPQAPEDKALQKLEEVNGQKEPEVKTPASKVVETVEPTDGELKELLGETQPKTSDPEKLIDKINEVTAPGKKAKMRERVMKQVKRFDDMKELANAGLDYLEAHVKSLPSSTEGRVEALMYDLASSEMTQNQITDAFASRFEVPPMNAALIVNDALASMEAKGLIKRFQKKGASLLRYDEKYVSDPDGNNLYTVTVGFTDTDMQHRMAIAKAVNSVRKMVNQDGSDVRYQPGQLKDGSFKALKDIPDERVDETFQPLLDFVQDMREQKLSVKRSMITQIMSALDGVGSQKQGTINEQLTPLKDGERDDSPLRTIAQLVYQTGEEGGLIRQEVTAGANGRVYTKNGLAHSQAGDLMKAILGTPEAHGVGGQAGLKWIFHGIGNLLGFDKKSPLERRNALFLPSPGMKGRFVADELYDFATKPFGQTTMKNSSGELTPKGKIVKDGEGFFQVLNAANEVKAMVDFLKARHPDKASMKPSQILQDETALKDLAENYQTDFIVQLDANNNAYQIAGLLMGYEDVMRATSLLPPVGAEGDADARQGADIYIEPAKAIAERIPELAALRSGPEESWKLSDSKLRKIFKRPIGTYLYAAEFNSRKKAFADALKEIAGDGEVFGLNEGDGLITIPESVIQGMQSPEGFMFQDMKYDVQGNEKKLVSVRKRVVANGDKWAVEVANGKGQWTRAGKSHADVEQAIKDTFAGDLYLRMNQELVRDMNVRFPGMRKYLKFSEVVSQIVKDRASQSGESPKVKVPLPDGVVLEYGFRSDPVFIGVDVPLGDRVVRLGIQSEDTKIGGRGMAAFMTHAHDAWALRETHKRLKAEGDLKAFNAIHDSYGFHPSNATRGQEIWYEVMGELGSPDYNIFLNIMAENNISVNDIRAAMAKQPAIFNELMELIMGRKGAPQISVNQSPTALS